VSKRDRRDDGRRGDRRDSQPEDEQQRRTGESDMQEGDSLTALKAILSKVATLLKPLQLTPDESIRLVEQLYSKVLETDLQLAAETDDTRKSSVLAAIQNATIRREGDKVIVDYSPVAAEEQPAPVGEAAAHAPAVESRPAGAAAGVRVEAAAGEARPATPAAAQSAGAGPDPADQTRVERAPRRAAPRRPASSRPAPAEAEPAD